jgi:hypothetical protein
MRKEASSRVARHPGGACVRNCCKGGLQNAQRRSVATSIGDLYQEAMREAYIGQGPGELWEGCLLCGANSSASRKPPGERVERRQPANPMPLQKGACETWMKSCHKRCKAWR